MKTSSDAIAAVRRRFSVADAAGRWYRMYEDDTERLEEANFRERQSVAVHYVAGIAEPGARVLDLGCGTGPVLAELRRRGIDVIGVDCSEDMLAYARSRLHAAGLPDEGLSIEDARDLPFADASFDIVICLGVIAYVEDYEPIIDEIARLLKPGGNALISFRSVFNPLASDPVRGLKRLLRPFIKPLLPARPPEPFEIGRPLDFRQVVAMLETRRLQFVEYFGIGFGPFRFAGRRLFSERRSIRISRRLSDLSRRFGIRQPLRWLTDVSLWVYRKPEADSGPLISD